MTHPNSDKRSKVKDDSEPDSEEMDRGATTVIWVLIIIPCILAFLYWLVSPENADHEDVARWCIDNYPFCE